MNRQPAGYGAGLRRRGSPDNAATSLGFLNSIFNAARVHLAAHDECTPASSPETPLTYGLTMRRGRGVCLMQGVLKKELLKGNVGFEK